MVGPAITVRHGAARKTSGYFIATKTSPKLAAMDAVTLSKPGDVMVIDGSACPAASNIGGIMATAVAEAAAGDIALVLPALSFGASMFHGTELAGTVAFSGQDTAAAAVRVARITSPTARPCLPVTSSPRCWPPKVSM